MKRKTKMEVIWPGQTILLLLLVLFIFKPHEDGKEARLMIEDSTNTAKRLKQTEVIEVGILDFVSKQYYNTRHKHTWKM